MRKILLFSLFLLAVGLSAFGQVVPVGVAGPAGAPQGQAQQGAAYNPAQFYGYQLGGAITYPLDFIIMKKAAPYFFALRGLTFSDLWLRYQSRQLTITFDCWMPGVGLVFRVVTGGDSTIISIEPNI